MSIAIATKTLYPEINARAKLALELFEKAELCNYPIVVADGGSCRTFVDAAIKRKICFAIQKGNAMGHDTRRAITGALALEEIAIWTEPEKPMLVSHADELAEPIRKGDADLVLVGRESLASLPWEQRFTEAVAADLIFRYVGLRADWYMGPRMMNRKAGEYITSFMPKSTQPEDDTWHTIFVPIVHMIADGLRVISIGIPYEHPLTQRREEEGNPEYIRRRTFQLRDIPEAIRTAAMDRGLYKLA